MEHIDILKEVAKELIRAKKKYPDDKHPWNMFDSDIFNIFEAVSIVHVEAGEAAKCAHKIVYNEKTNINDLKAELIQTIATAIRVLEKL